MLIVSWFRYVYGLIQTRFLFRFLFRLLFGLLQTVSVLKQNYCIYTQWFEFGLQAPKAIKFGHLAQLKKTRLKCLQAPDAPQMSDTYSLKAISASGR
jgi:hypothetical protein